MRWTKIDDQNYRNNEIAQEAVRAWAEARSIGLGWGLMSHAAESLMRVNLGSTHSVGVDVRAYDEACNPGHVQDKGGWRHLTDEEIVELSVLRVVTPYRSKAHLARWDERQASYVRPIPPATSFKR